MLVAVYVGNTNSAIGLFSGDALQASYRLHTHPQATADEYAFTVGGMLRGCLPADAAPLGSVLASVVPPLTPIFQQVLDDVCGRPPLVVDAGVKTGVPVKYEPPRDVGADRVVNAVAVQHEYGVPAVIIDFGTMYTCF